MVIKVNKKPNPNVKLADVEEIALLEYSRNAVKTYGSSVLEDRAIVDYRDGLKPVQRRTLWAMYDLGLLGSKGVLKKSARVVGEVLGKYHPHGDKSVYDAMVTQVSSVPVPTIFGDGNWGDAFGNDPAAAMRYTECHLTKYSDQVFFDKRYTPVIESLSNFDGSEKEPLILPAQLPNVLLNGTFGIAVGGTAHIPAFHPDGVKKLVKKALTGKDITVNDCLKNLQFVCRTGGDYLDDEDDENVDSHRGFLRQFYKTGVGPVWFISIYEWNSKARTMRFNKFAYSLNLEKAIATVAELDVVTEVEDLTSIENGICYQIHLKRSSEMTDSELCDYIADFFSTKATFRVNVTERYYDDVENEVRATFRGTTVPQLIMDWSKWRIQLEVDSLNYWMSVVDDELARLNLLLLAINNRQVILDSLEKDDSEKYLITKLKITVEQAKFILDMPIRRLKKLNAVDVNAKVKEASGRKAIITKQLKDPAAKLSAELDELVV